MGGAPGCSRAGCRLERRGSRLSAPGARWSNVPRRITMTHSRAGLGRGLCVLLVGTSLLGCGKKDDDAPELPPADTMTFYELREGTKSEEMTGQALTQEAPAAVAPGPQSNVKV